MPAPALNPPSAEARTLRLLTLAFAVFAFTCAFFHVSDADVGYHIRTGEHILETGRIPDRNTFSFAIPDAPWTLQQWWPATMYAVVWLQTGLAGLITFKALLAAAVLLVTLAAARREAAPGSLWPFWVLTVTALIARVRFFERPDLVSAVLFAVLLLVDARKQRERLWQWLGVPLFMAFWANTHAGYIYGFVLLCCWSGAEWLDWFWRGRRGRPRPDFRELFVRPVGIALGAVAAVASAQVINPSGYRALMVPIEQFLDPFWRSVIAEYLPPKWESSKLLYSWVGALAVVQAVSWQRVNLRLLVPALVFGYLACATQRSLLVFSLAAAPLASFLLDRIAVPRGDVLRWLHHGLLAPAWLALGLLVTRDTTLPFGVGLHRAYYPMSVYRFLDAEAPRQRLFNEMRFGGSMLWWLWPKFPPFIDGRGDTYTPEFWQKEFMPILYAQPGWKEKLAAGDMHAVLVPIINAEVTMLANTLRGETNWALVSFNDTAMLFLERTELNRDVIARHEFKQLWPGDRGYTNIVPGNVAARAEAERALASDPRGLFAQTAVARAAFVNGDFQRAAAMLGPLARRRGVEGDYWRDYGYALFRLGRMDEADEVFRRVAKRGPRQGFAWFMRHHIALAREDVAGADECLREALRFEPENPEYRAARARFDAAMGKR
jgi:hypothetical protein